MLRTRTSRARRSTTSRSAIRLFTRSRITCLHGRKTIHATTGTRPVFERANGRLYLSADFALPCGLEPEDQIALAHAFAQKLTADERLPYTLLFLAKANAKGGIAKTSAKINSNSYDG